MIFTRVTEHFSLRLYSLGWSTITPETWAFPNRASVFWTLYHNDRAGAHIQTGETPLPLAAGQNYLIPRSCPYRYWCDRDINHFFLYFDILGLSRAATQTLFPAPFSLDVSAPDSRALAEAAAHPQRVVSLRAHWQYLAALTSGVMRALDALPPERLEQGRQRLEGVTDLAAALQHIEANLSQPLPNHELAACCRMSKDHFIRRFREQIGQTPTQYVLEARTKKAAQLLLFSDLSLEAVAAESGFGNRYYFTRVFSRQMGVGPSAYRKRRLR